jgi:hypothetical protein
MATIGWSTAAVAAAGLQLLEINTGLKQSVSHAGMQPTYWPAAACCIYQPSFLGLTKLYVF